MFDCTDVTAATSGSKMDPRLQTRHVRCLNRTDGLGTILLLGVVHDHPASIHRVDAILKALEPDVLAIELPPLALPLFRMYSRDVYVPPRLGGEMSLALQTADSVRGVGIDAPNRIYLRRLFMELADQSLPTELLVPVARNLLSSAAHALACRLGALIGTVTPLRPRVYSHHEYSCTLLDVPDVQAEHEMTHLTKQQSFLRAVEIPRWRRFVDDKRDESMATVLQDLRLTGDVIAVVGMEHLDSLQKRLEAPT